VPVVDGAERRRVVGAVTDRDACMASYTRGRRLTEIRVETMSTGIRSCKPSDDLTAAEATMREAQVHRLPVVDEASQLLGVVSLADIARQSVRRTESKSRQVDPAEIAETVASILRPRTIAASTA
jgi:CBS domain-containing protein